MITLYQFGNSVCCQKVRIVLFLKQLAWQSQEVNLFLNEQYSPEYLKLNPSGVVPTLVDDGDAVIESTLICEYLDEKYTDPPLMPDGPSERANVRRWSKLVDEGLHEGISAISFSATFRERMKGQTEAQRQQRYNNIGDPKRGDLFRLTYEHGAKARPVVYAVAAYEKMFKRLEDALQDGRTWITGDAPSLGDIALMPYIARLHFLGLLQVWISDRPNILRWWNMVQEWPGYVAGILEPMTDAERGGMEEHGPKIRDDIAAILDQCRAAPVPA